MIEKRRLGELNAQFYARFRCKGPRRCCAEINDGACTLLIDHTFGDAELPKIVWSFWFGKSVASMLGSNYA